MPGGRCRDLPGENHPPSQAWGNDPYHCQCGESARAHTHTQKASREYKIISTEILSTSIENLPTERWKKFLRVRVRLWIVFCYTHHLKALRTLRSQSARPSSNYSRNKESLAQKPAIWFKTSYKKKKEKKKTFCQTDRWTGGGRTRGTCGYTQLAGCFLFFLFLIKINISNPHWPPA